MISISAPHGLGSGLAVRLRQGFCSDLGPVHAPYRLDDRFLDGPAPLALVQVLELFVWFVDGIELSLHVHLIEYRPGEQ
jgi:hypothetical protein